MIEDEEDQELFDAMFPPPEHPTGPSDPRAEKLAQAALDRFNFVTVATYATLLPGEVIEDVMKLEGHKVVVLGPATRQDWENQKELAYELDRAYYLTINYDVRHMHFYKVVAE